MPDSETKEIRAAVKELADDLPGDAPRRSSDMRWDARSRDMTRNPASNVDGRGKLPACGIGG